MFESKYSLPWYDRPEIEYTAKTEAECSQKTGSIAKHAYYASILSICYEAVNETSVPVSTLRFGFVISKDYILSPVDDSMVTEMGCDHNVQVLAGNFTYKAKLMGKDMFARYKLETPIKLGPRAWPVMMIEAHDKPKPGDEVTIIGLSYHSSTDKFGVIQLANVTLLRDRDIRRTLLNSRHSIPYVTRGDLFWANYPENRCIYNVFFTSMFVGNKLIGIRGTPIYNHNGRKIQGYLDLAQQRASIKRLTGV